MNEWSHKAQLIVIRDFTCRDQSLYIRLLISSYREISSYIKLVNLSTKLLGKKKQESCSFPSTFCSGPTALPKILMC